MAAAIPFLLAATTAVSVIGAIRSAQADTQAATYNQQVAQRNVVIADQQGEAQELQLRRDQNRRLGQIRANIGASGVALEGSPLDILEESTYEAEMDVQTLRYNTAIRRMGYADQAALYSAEASNAKSGGYLRAGSALLSGATQYALTRR